LGLMVPKELNVLIMPMMFRFLTMDLVSSNFANM
jgi:hypothetical protein